MIEKNDKTVHLTEKTSEFESTKCRPTPSLRYGYKVNQVNLGSQFMSVIQVMVMNLDLHLTSTTKDMTSKIRVKLFTP